MTYEIPNDPLDFFKNMWGGMGFSLPGMVVPTADTDELGQRIANLKAVEGWLKSNLGLLQMTIQGLEMQRATLMAFQQMSMAAQESAQVGATPPNPFLDPAAWPMPWDLLAARGSSSAPDAPPAAATAATVTAPAAAEPPPAKPKRSPRKKSQPKG